SGRPSGARSPRPSPTTRRSPSSTAWPLPRRWAFSRDDCAVLAPVPLNPILPAQDGARAEAFYRDVLGLDQVSPPGADPMAFTAGNGETIVLSAHHDRVP